MCVKVEKDEIVFSNIETKLKEIGKNIVVYFLGKDGEKIGKKVIYWVDKKTDRNNYTSTSNERKTIQN